MLTYFARFSYRKLIVKFDRKRGSSARATPIGCLLWLVGLDKALFGLQCGDEAVVLTIDRLSETAIELR
jgi:hypothetical protein